MRPVLVVVLVAACGSDPPTCKEAVEQAARTMYGTSANKDRTTMMIGTCEQDEWPAEMRRCVTRVEHEPELALCFAKAKRKARDPLVARESNAGGAIRKFEEFTNDMCACKDKACADRVNDRMTKWGTDMARSASKDDKVDPDAAKKMSTIMERFTTCMTKVMVANVDVPQLVGLSPTTGDTTGGTYVLLRGSNFTNLARSAKVYFGSRQGTIVRFANDGELFVQAPAGRDGEVVDVRVVFDPGGEQKLDRAFTFVDKGSAP